MFTPTYYLQRAAELEALAERAPDSALPEGYQNLARAFRDMANMASVSQSQSDEEALRLAERMVGKGISTH